MTSSIRRPVAPTRVVAIRDGQVHDVPDTLAGEEPMEIRVESPGAASEPVAVTMRTPGHDFELAVGFLATEGVLHQRDVVAQVRYCDLPDRATQQYNVVTVSLRAPIDTSRLRRNVYASSSCGMCGKASIEQVHTHTAPVPPGPVVPLTTVLAIPAHLRDEQRVFDRTGGLHAAGLFDAHGTLEFLREDVGRHNAIDKVVGRAFLDGRLPLTDGVLGVSGRVSFEVVQKAASAGIAMIVAVSAPTSLAVAAAREFGQTVVGFVRDRACNIYTHPERVDLDA